MTFAAGHTDKFWDGAFLLCRPLRKVGQEQESMWHDAVVIGFITAL